MLHKDFLFILTRFGHFDSNKQTQVIINKPTTKTTKIVFIRTKASFCSKNRVLSFVDNIKEMR